ncbi:MAG: xylulose kinase [Promethearchaeota archaeon Loki_b31]|nr:MAG: xylulose kinase [Candidatus Lokiarchaeota archaeon Loki_b31]
MSDSQKKYILAIDHGTGGPKTAIVSTHGEVVDWAFQEVPLHIEKGGGVEQDPNDWWNAILKTSKKVIDGGFVSVEDIVGVCNTSQWSGTIPLDKNGNHLMNAIIWMDTRGAPYIKNIYKGLIKFSGINLIKALKWVKRTGGAPGLSGKDPIAHMLFIKNEYSEIYDKTYMFLEPQDYINLKLTGKFASSYTTIGVHWLTDIRKINRIKYSKKLIKMCKLDQSKLPSELVNSTDILGPITKEVADELGLEKNVKVIAGAPDVPSAAIGSGAVKDYDTHIYIGTSDWVICHIPFKKTDIFHSIGAIVSGIPGRYMVIDEQEIAGGALSFLRDKILYHKDELLREEAVPDVYKIFDRMVENVPAGSNNLIFTPWLIGERSPVDDHTIRGGFYNLSLEMSREHLIRAIFEGVAYNIKWLFIYLEKFIQKRKIKDTPGMIKKDIVIPEVSIIGGGANSKIWCQIFADVLDRTIKQVKDPIQTNARGAAFMASVGLGYLTWDQIPELIEYSNVFKPNSENRAIYDKLFSEYVNIYKIMKKMYKRLNE